MSTTAPKASTWRNLLAITARTRHDPDHAATTATLRLGTHPATETPCLRHTGWYMSTLPVAQRPAARRAIALCAKHPGISATDSATWMPPGATFAHLHRTEHHCAPGEDGPNTITGSVDMLPMLDLDGCVNVLDILMTRAAATEASMNFFALARTLMDWGTGIDDASRAARSRIVADFYSATV